MLYNCKKGLPHFQQSCINLPFGRVAEWPIASVLKTEGPQGSVGSNPTSSDLFLSELFSFYKPPKEQHKG